MRWPFTPRPDAEPPAKPPEDESAPASVSASASASATSGPTPDDREVVEALARRFLPEPFRDRWLALASPGVHLVRAQAGERWVVRLGGLPRMPEDQPWPQWPGHGPLSYVAEIDCAAAQEFELPLRLPDTGRLLFFYFDGSYDDFDSVVGSWDPSSAAGAQTVLVPEPDSGAERPAPPDVPVFGEAFLAGRAIVTFPGWEHPDLRAEFWTPGQDLRDFQDHPVLNDTFREALDERCTEPLHQLGGYAVPIQGPVEHEVAEFVLGARPADDSATASEAARWELLLQVDTDDDLGMEWGDCGVLYWLARPTDLAEGDLSQIRFTWQCG